MMRFPPPLPPPDPRFSRWGGHHPQFLWNNQEFVLRMLTQNACGIGMFEKGNRVRVSLKPEESRNVVAFGPADICGPSLENGGKVPHIELETDTDTVKWIYCRMNGSGFYCSTDRPRYCSIHHGWYHETNRHEWGRDRAVVFIDAELPPGFRCIVMDSPNSMFEYDVRNPDTGGELVWEITAPSDGGWESRLLTPGNYRFELRGGNGGRGGGIVPTGGANLLNPPAGGAGGRGQVLVCKIRILAPTTFFGLLGGDGEQGEDGEFHASIPNGFIPRQYITGGGGGSSGGDTRLRIGDRLINNALGGAGGGGAVTLSSIGSNWANGAGGGGAGNPTGAEDGAVGSNALNPSVAGGRAGTITAGGEGGLGLTNDNVWAGNSGQRGDNGQNIDAATRRNGGSSRSIQVAPGGTVPPFTVPGAAGGSRINGTSGYFRCYMTRDGDSW